MSKKRTASSLSIFENKLYEHIDAYRLADHTELIKELFAIHGLDEYLKLYTEFHKHQDQDFYHATDHAHMTALNCFEGALYNKCSASEVKILLVAGLYHDARHSQGSYSDKVNIPQARTALQAVHNFMPAHKQLKEKELASVLQAITHTHYPYLVKSVTSELCRILRDADMMSAYCGNEEILLRMFKGLRREVNVTRYDSVRHDYDYEKPMTMTEFCEKQIRFATQHVWNTQWAKVKAFKLNWPQVNKVLCQKLLMSAVM